MDLGSFVFALLLLQAGDETGAEGEGQTPEPRGSLQRPLTAVAARGVPGARRCRVGCRGPTAGGLRGEGATGRGLKGRGGEPTCRVIVPPPTGAAATLRSMRATDRSKRQGREYDRWVSVFLSSWAAATSCSTGLLGYIFETFNKLTCCIITHVYVYLCLSQKSWVFHRIQGHTPSAAHDHM
jgi:hypothetical protein